MSDDLDDLARLAADALVSAVVTDSWEAVKRRFAALVGHERRMDATRTELAAKSGPDRDRAQLAQARIWSTRLRDVLDDDPGVAEGLRALLADLGTAAPPAAPASQHARAGHESQAVNVGGNISGNAGEVYVGVGNVDKRKTNLALAPFMFIGGAAKKAAAAHPAAATATTVVVLLGAATVTGWRTHWPTAVFGATAPKATTGLPLLRSSAKPPAPSPADSNPATTFSDGSRVEITSAGAGPGDVHVTLRITAGQSALALGRPGALQILPVGSNKTDPWSSPESLTFNSPAAGYPQTSPDLRPGQSVCVGQQFDDPSNPQELLNVSSWTITMALGNGTTGKKTLPAGGGAGPYCNIG